MKVIDPGHRYQLLSLDGPYHQELRFVKRCQPKERYPGNFNAHPGTTIQSVMRCLIEREQYLQNQVWCFENLMIIFLLKFSIWLLEFRAARRHKKPYWHWVDFSFQSPLCSHCGHTQCDAIPTGGDASFSNPGASHKQQN